MGAAAEETARAPPDSRDASSRPLDDPHGAARDGAAATPRTVPTNPGETDLMTTLRQIDANRRNAQKSTGPRTPEGKARSRGNALVHGLSGAGVVLSPDDHDEVAERLVTWRPSYRPETPQGEWYFRQLVVNSVRIDRCQRDEAVQLQYVARRAAGCWDDDRRVEAETLAVGLSARPALTAAKLRQNKHGALWLVDRWRGLAEAAETSGGAWSESESATAFDLLGTPPDRRTRATVKPTPRPRPRTTANPAGGPSTTPSTNIPPGRR